jgi:hypothetical protein
MQSKTNGTEPKGTQHLKKDKHKGSGTQDQQAPESQNTVVTPTETNTPQKPVGEEALIDKQIQEAPKLTLKQSLFDGQTSQNLER